nr:hypothetical protein [Candidatus Woesebacteria bacterium]
MDSWEKIRATEKSFKYSAENPPPLEILLDKLFAVHVTPILPKGGVMKAGARDVSHDGRHNGEEPPSFRPTIHFSLGEVVQSHGHHSWEEQPYAVVLPLRSLVPQLVNVFCNDTFVLGDFMVPNSAVVFVPQGTDCRSLPETISIVTYPATIPLRLVISDYIESMNGWHVKMNPESTSVGSQALVANTNINVPEFFKELFAHYPHVAFGSHINSERGEAYRFGLIEQCVNLLMRGYDNGAPPLETDMIDLSIKLVMHNLTQLESMLKNVRSLPPDALAIFEQKKRAVYDWLAIANLDLYHRRTSGMSLNRRNQTLITQLKSNRKYPELFANIISTTPGAFDRVTEDTPLDPSMTAMMLAAMPPHEVNQFISHNQLLFAQLDKNNLYLLYAVERWTIVGSEKAHLENLDALVEVTLTHGIQDRQLHDRKDAAIIEVLKPYLRLDSARLATALEVLNIPSVRSHLEKKYGYTFPPSGVHS